MPRAHRLTWRQIADELEAEIRAGRWAPGELIPSYRQTADRYGVSITTASKAIARLTDRGLIEADPGRGNVVVDDLPESPS